MIVSNPNPNFIVKNICDGAGCFKEATQTIIEKVGAKGPITLQLCKDCAASFCVNSVCSSMESKKKEFEQEVEGPTCSSTFRQNQTSQLHREVIG